MMGTFLFLFYQRAGKLAILAKNCNTINIYSIRNINNSLSASVIEDEYAPTQLIIDKISSKIKFTYISHVVTKMAKQQNMDFWIHVSIPIRISHVC